MQKNTYKYYIGIDVSKHKLDVSSSGPGRDFKVDNSEQGINELIKRCELECREGLFVLEASGGYERLPLQSLSKKGYSIALANAKRVRDYAKSQGILAKTDKIDARVIRRFAMHSELKEYQIKDETSELKRDLSGRREQLIKLIVIEKQRLEKASACMKKSIQRVIKMLEKELDKIDLELKNQIKQDTNAQKIIERLSTVPGIGETIATQLHIRLPELGKVCNKSIAALSGLAPFNHESGQYKGKRKISGGRFGVRKSLFLAALTATRYNKKIKLFYERLQKNGKCKMVAIVACMRKLVVILNIMIKKEVEWQS
jgi:transposase